MPHHELAATMGTAGPLKDRVHTGVLATQRRTKQGWFTPADSLALDLWGLAPSQGLYSTAEENKPNRRLQNSPPASWFLFCNELGLKNVAVGTFPPSQPACEWVPGTSNSSYSGERRQELSLDPG